MTLYSVVQNAAGKARPGSAGCGSARQARPGKAGHGMAGQAWHGLVGQGMAGLGRRGPAWHGMARRGMAGRGRPLDAWAEASHGTPSGVRGRGYRLRPAAPRTVIVMIRWLA